MCIRDSWGTVRAAIGAAIGTTLSTAAPAAPIAPATPTTRARSALCLRRGRVADRIDVRSFGKLVLFRFTHVAGRDLIAFAIPRGLQLILFEVFFVFEVVFFVLELHGLRPRELVDGHIANHAAQVRCMLQRLLFHLFVGRARVDCGNLAVFVVEQLFLDVYKRQPVSTCRRSWSRKSLPTMPSTVLPCWPA